MIRFLLILLVICSPLSAETPFVSLNADRVDILVKDGSLQLAVFQHMGVFVSTDGGVRWFDRTKGLPLRIVYPDYNDGPRTITSADIGGSTGTSVLLTIADDLYFSPDLGITWERVKTGLPLKYADFFTAVALNPEHEKQFLLGTSFTGIFETKDGGKSWKQYSDNVKNLHIGAGFYDDVSAVGYFSGGIAFVTGYTDMLHVSSSMGVNWKKHELPKAADGAVYTRITGTGQEEGQISLFIAQANENSGSRVFYTLDETDQRSNSGNIDFSPGLAQAWDKQYKTAKDIRLSRASNRHGMYVSSWNASGKTLDKHISFMKEHGLDSLVIDFKDDTGKLTYNSSLELPKSLGAIRADINLQELVKKARDNKIYLIARIVVFKDEILYKYDGKRLAIQDKNGGSWGKRVKEEIDGKEVLVQREFWVDPYNPEVWDYNIAIAKELQDAGLDEIQFDYIRFPSDGNLSRAVFPARRRGQKKIDALESFLRKAREVIKLPVSTDIFGFNGWYRMGNWIGQSLDILKDYVDVICPMFYPSHFSARFLTKIDYLNRAERIYFEGSNRAVKIVGNNTIIRPYVQAFLLPQEYYMEEPEYSSYLEHQLDGTTNSSASGFTLWNQSNHYYMVTSPLKRFTELSKNSLSQE